MTTPLPKNLRPWVTELSRIHTSCWPLLGQLLPKLDGSLFQPATGMDDADQQPDGFDGIEYRGDLNRLLANEWGLFETYPDEFSRRLTMGESQYLKLGYQKQNRPQAFHILLDRGPDQYGAPFLIQLALLLVLARRARELNLSLHVGYLQEPSRWRVATPQCLESTIHPHLSHARLMPEMLAAWHRDISSSHSQSQVGAIDPNTLWIAASPREDIPFGQVLQIASDCYTEKGFEVVFQPNQQRFNFQLPSTDEALRLLRRPFMTRSRLAKASTPQRLKHFQVHPVSRTCFFYTDHQLLTLKIPKKLVGNMSQLKKQTKDIRQPLVGIWHSKNRTATVTIDDNKLQCIDFFKQAKFSISFDELPQPFAIPKTVGQPPFAYVLRDHLNAIIVIKDAEQQGFLLKLKKPSASKPFAFQDAIALGEIVHEYFFEQSLFYADGTNAFYEISAKLDIPVRFNCDHPVLGFIRRYGKIDGRHTNAFPMMKDAQGNWDTQLWPGHILQPEDDLIGSIYNRLFVKRGTSQILALQRVYGGKDVPAPQLILEDVEPIETVILQTKNNWIVYETPFFLKVYDLTTSTEIVAVELAADD